MGTGAPGINIKIEPMQLQVTMVKRPKSQQDSLRFPFPSVIIIDKTFCRDLLQLDHIPFVHYS